MGLGWVKSHHLIVGGYIAFGLYAWYKWNTASGSTSPLAILTWPYQLATGAPAPWSVGGVSAPSTPPPPP